MPVTGGGVSDFYLGSEELKEISRNSQVNALMQSLVQASTAAAAAASTTDADSPAEKAAAAQQVRKAGDRAASQRRIEQEIQQFPATKPEFSRTGAEKAAAQKVSRKVSFSKEPT